MKTIGRLALSTCAATLMLAAQPAAAQSLDELPIITLIKLKGEKYEDAVRYLADRDKVAAEAGLPADVYYFHRQGAGWHIIVISEPWPDDADEKMEAAGKKLGMTKPAPGTWISMLADHEDIIVSGPTTAAAVVAKWDEQKND